MAGNYWWEDYEEESNGNQGSTQQSGTKGYWWDDGSEARTASMNITNRVNTWLNNHNNYIKNYQNRYGSRKFDYSDSYVGDSAKWLDTVSRQADAFEAERQSILAYMDQNKRYLDEEWMNDIRKTLADGSYSQSQIRQSATQDNDWWNSFGSDQELVTKYGSAEGVYNYFQRADGWNTKYSGLTDDGIKQALSTLEDGEEKDWLDSWQWRRYFDESDFDKYSNAGAAIKNPTIEEGEAKDEGFIVPAWKTPKFINEVGNIVTYSRENADMLAMASMYDGKTQGNYVYRSMEDDEVKLYNYLLAKYGKEKGEEFLSYIMDDLLAREGGARANRLMGIDIPVVEEAAIGLQGLMSGVDQWATGARQNLTNELQPATVDQYANSALMDSMSGFGKYAYQATNVIGNMLPSIALSKGLGALGAGMKAARLVGAATMSFGAAGNAYADGVREYGMEPWQARTYGTLVGISEGALEYALGGIPGISKGDSFIDAKIRVIDNGLLRIGAKLGWDVVEEIREEELQEFLEPLFRSFFTGEYDTPTFEELLETAIVTAISTPFMGGGDTIIDDVKGGKEALKKYGNKTNELIKEGLESKVDSESFKLAQKYKAQTLAGKSMTGNQIRNLLAANQEQITPKDLQKIKKAAEKRLADLGQTEDVSRLAELATKYATGQKLTRAEKYELSSSDYGSRVANELTPKNIESGEYTTDWAEDIGTKQVNAKAYNKKKIDQVRSIIEQMQSTEDPAQYKSLTERAGTEGRFGVSESGKAVIRSTGEEIDINSLDVATVGDGELTFQVGDREVSAGDIDFVDDNQSFLVSAVSNIENITAKDATVIIHELVDMDKPLGMQLNAIDEAFTYGFYDYSAEDLKAGLFAKNLSNEKLMSAYELGKAARKDSDIDSDAPAIKMRTAAEAKMTAEQKTAQQKARIESDDVEVYFMDGEKVVKFDEHTGKYDDKRTAAVNTAKFLRKLGIGGKYYFFESYLSETLKDENGNAVRVYKDAKGEEVEAPNGAYYDSDGSIHIDLNAGDAGQGTALFTMGHELGHFIKARSKKQFKVLGDLVKEAFDKTNLSMHQRVLDKQKFLEDKRKEPVSYDEAYEEVVCDALSTMLTDGSFYEKLMEIKVKDKGLFNTIKRFFEKMIAKFKEVYAKLTPDQRDARDIRDVKDMFDKIQTAFVEGLVEASDNFHAAMESVVEENAEPMSTDEIITDGAVVTDGNGERHSIRSMKHDIADGKMFDDLKNVCGWTNAQVNTLRTQLKDLVEYMIPYRNILDMNETYGMEGRRFAPYKPNSDPLYKISMDFSTLCSKRLLTQYVIEQLQLREKRPMSAEEQMAIRDMLNEYRKVEKGLQVACAMCYVEAARLKSPKQIQRWLDDPTPHLINYFALKNTEFNATVKKAQADFKESRGYDRNAPKKDMKQADVKELNKIGPELRSKYQPSAAELEIIERAKALPNETYLTAGNLADLSENESVIYDAYTSFVRTATRSKSLEKDEPYYYGDSTRDNGNGIVVTDSFIEAVNKENGMRFSSWSDWRIQHLLDYITAVIDNSVRGAAMHGYTKFGDEVRVLGKTGMMFNMSGVAGTQTGLNEDGSLSFSPTESIDVNEAIQLREEFPEHAGLQCIGVSNEHIVALLRSDIIDYVIPYHVSGLNAVLRRMVNIYGWADYTGTQHASIDKSIKLEDAVDKEHWHEEPVFSEFFVGYDTGMSGIEAMRASAEKYKQMCKDRGLTPKFNQFATEENYWKLLIDRKMINQQTGNLIRQKAVTPTFDFDTIKGVVDKFVDNYDAGLEARALNHIVENWDSIPQRIKDLKKQGSTKAKKTKKAAATLANQTVAAQQTKNSDRKVAKTFKNGQNANGVFVANVLIDLANSDSKWWTGTYNHVIFSMSKSDDTEFTQFHQEIEKRTKDMEEYGKAGNHIVEDSFTIRDGNGKEFIYRVTLDGYMHGVVLEKIDKAKIVAALQRVTKGGANGKPVANIKGRTRTARSGMGRNSAGNGRNRASAGSPGSSGLGSGSPQGNQAGTNSGGKSADQKVPAVSEYTSLAELSARAKWLREQIKSNRVSKEKKTEYRRELRQIQDEMDKRMQGYFPSRESKAKKSERNNAPTFYSQMGKVVEGMKQEKFGASSVISMLRGRGVKAEEIRWSGIQAFLDGKKSVTKAELQEFIAGSMLHIEEEHRVVNEPRDEFVREWQRLVEYLDAEEILDGLNYINTSLPAHLESLVENEDLNQVEADRLLDLAHKAVDSEDLLPTNWDDYKLDGGENYRELVFKMPGSTYTNSPMKAHWGSDAQGVLAHARMQDFDVDGKKMLFIEEIQSDWHNAGHKGGYTTKEDFSANKSASDAVRNLENEMEDYLRSEDAQAFVNRFMEYYDLEYDDRAIGRLLTMSNYDFNRIRRMFPDSAVHSNVLDRVGEYTAKRDRLIDEANEIFRAVKDKAPDAPFKDTYHEFVLKRLLRMAAEEGYDSIGWTTADIQSERWDEDYAEGYRIEYDQDIPKFLKKYGKQWGAEVGKTEIDTRGVSEWEREMVEKGIIELVPDMTKVWSMDITPAMKESVLKEGQPMYSERAKHAKEYFGTTDNPYHAGYMLADGTMLNFRNENNRMGWDLSWVDDDALAEGVDPYHIDHHVIYEMYDGKYDDDPLEAIDQFIDEGNVRIVFGLSDTENAIQLSPTTKPTAKQYDMIRQLADQTFSEGKTFGVGLSGFKTYDKYSNGSAVVNDIKYYYANGKQRDSVVRDFHYSERGNGTSNRDLLANAFEGLSQNSDEYKMIQEYKGRIKLLNEQESKLAKLNAEIREIRFTEGKYDAKKLKELEAKAKNIANDINRQDRKLLDMEVSEPFRKVIEQERKKEAQKTKAHVKEIQQNKKLRAEQTELRHKIRKAVRDLDKLLNRGNKKTNVKEDMKDFVSKALEIADYLFTDHISNDELIRRGITVPMRGNEAKLVKETEDIIAKLDAATDINQPGSKLTDEEFTRLDEKRRRNLEKLKDLLTEQRNARLSTPVSKLFDDLVKAYASLKNSSQDAVKAAYNEELEKSLRAFMSDDKVKILENMRIADMTTEELNWLYRAYTMVLTNVRNANKFHVKGMNETIDQKVDRIVSDFSSRKIPDKKIAVIARNLANKMGWDYEKLHYALDRIGSEAFTELIMNLANSENIVMADVIEAALFRDKIVERYGFNNWDVNKQIDREFLDNTGKKFKLTLGELMSLYAYSRREGAWDHIEYGGFVFGKNDVTNPKPADTYKLSKKQCEAITNTLTKEHKGYVEEMQKFLSETMGAKGNEVSMMLYGIKMFGEKNYFPIHIAGEYMARANESQAKSAAGFGTMSNAGFTHAQNPNAKAPFVLESFNEVWADHVNEMSRYHGAVPALEDIRRVMNRSSYSDAYNNSVSVTAAMENAFGKAAVDYFDNLYREANSGAITDKLQRIPKKLLSLFRKNSVAYSLSVLIQQPTSIIRAYAMIPKKYFGFKGFGTITSGVVKAVTSKWNSAYSDAYNEMLKYAPGVTLAKEIGGFDTHTGGSIRSYLLDTNKSLKQKWKTGNALEKGKAALDLVDNNVIANLPNVADKIAWIEIWNACKRETVATHKDLVPNSEEFMQAVGERFTEVIRATQVYDSIFAKSPMMKSKNLAVQYLTSFMNEPNTVANMAESAVRDAVRGDWKSGAKKAVVLVYGTLAVGMMKSLIYALRDDDEDETYVEKYLESLVGSLVSDFNPLSYIPVVRDVSSALQGYDVERPDMSIIVDAIEALQAKNNLANKDTEDMTEAQLAELEKKMDEATWDVVESLASFFGIPVKNIRRDVKAIFVNKSANADLSTKLSLTHKLEEALNSSQYFFMRDESKSKQDKLYEAIVAGDTTYVNRLKAGYKDENSYNSAVRKVLRENDPRIHEAALAYYHGNIDEYKRIFKEIRNDDKHNLVGFDNTMEAVMSEVSSIKGKLEGKTESSSYNATDFVNAILVGNTDLALTMKEDIIAYKMAHGSTRIEADVSFNSSVSTSTRNAFDSNLVDEAGVEKMLQEYAGMDEEEAVSKVDYWSFIKAHPQYRGDLNEAQVEKYHEFAEPAEIPLDVFVQYLEGTKGLADIKDEWGDVVESKRDQVLEVIDSLPLTWQQKDALYLAAGYAESKIWDVPW